MQPSKLFACLSIFIVIVLSLLPASAATNEDLAGDTASAQKPHLFQSTSLSGAAVTEPTSTNIIGEFDPVISQQAYLKASDSLPNKNFGDAEEGL